MFTGIVEELGRLEGRDGARFTFAARLVTDDAEVGGSIAVNGCCLTVVALGDGRWEADVVDETLSRTNLGDLRPGDPVNLERPLRLSDRLGGHLVQGHVDAVGEVAAGAPDLVVHAPSTRYLVEKGSVTVDGVSLTVSAIGADFFEVSLIPTTLALTTLGAKQPGDPVNLEVDVIAKYVERLLQNPGGTAVTEVTP